MSRIALVTGGTRGIGEAICIHLKKKGYNVVASYGGNDQDAAAFSDRNQIPAKKFDVSNFDETQKAIK